MSIEKFRHKERLKKVREEHLQISQQELANQLGIPVHRVKDIESGKTRVPIELAIQLEETFHLDFKWVLTGQGQMIAGNQPSPSDKPQHVDTDLLRQVIEAVEGGLSRSGVTVEPGKKARLVSLLYEYSVETGKPIGTETVQKFLALMA